LKGMTRANTCRPSWFGGSKYRHRVLFASPVLLALVGEIAAWAVPASAAPVSTIYVANAGTPSTVTVVNSAMSKVAKSIPIHDGIAVSIGVEPNGAKAYAVVVGSDEAGSPGVLVPISTKTNIAGKAIDVGVDPQSVAFNPNGRFAYVVNGFDAATTAPSAPGTITPVNLTEGVSGAPIKVGTNPGNLAITPNGQTAYVTDSNALNGDPTTITPVNLTTNTPEKTIDVAARAIAITLNGATAFALGQNGVIPIATATNRVGKTIEIRGLPQAIALSPDGQTAWVLATPDPGLEPGSNKVTLSAINTATYAVGKVVTLSGLPATGQFFIAITPNGAHIYVLGQGPGKTASTVIAVAAATDVAGKPIKVGAGDTALAVDPDNELVYVLSPGSDYQGPPISSRSKNVLGTVIPITAATNKVGRPIKVGLLASAMAVTR
jgi:DNA-binding beta-propeller fold protein YncE